VRPDRTVIGLARSVVAPSIDAQTRIAETIVVRATLIDRAVRAASLARWDRTVQRTRVAVFRARRAGAVPARNRGLAHASLANLPAGTRAAAVRIAAVVGAARLRPAVLVTTIAACANLAGPTDAVSRATAAGFVSVARPVAASDAVTVDRAAHAGPATRQALASATVGTALLSDAVRGATRPFRTARFGRRTLTIRAAAAAIFARLALGVAAKRLSLAGARVTHLAGRARSAARAAFVDPAFFGSTISGAALPGDAECGVTLAVERTALAVFAQTRLAAEIATRRGDFAFPEHAHVSGLADVANAGASVAPALAGRAAWDAALLVHADVPVAATVACAGCAILAVFAALISAKRLRDARARFADFPHRALTAVVLVAAAIGDDPALCARRAALERETSGETARPSRQFAAILGLDDAEIAQAGNPLARSEEHRCDDTREDGNRTDEPIPFPPRAHPVDLNRAELAGRTGRTRA